ncbi:hypothetical protein [Bacillus dakarensis]|uniref:hypothetical protein n=1 Tax=Robertmurraya dakarensis TaxID=1926278 RepID=UPI0012B6884E|nr:hypothetical protein [Bacillus dakarensis]
MKDKKSEAEYANNKIDQFFNSDNNQDSLDIEPLISNNNRLLVIEGNDEENK